MTSVAGLLTAQLQQGRRGAQGHLVVLIGLSYSGKSTLAATLHAHGYAHVLITTVKAQTGLQTPEVMAQLPEPLTAALKAGAHVVLDQMNITRAVRVSMYEAARAAGARLTVLYLDESLAERKRRRTADPTDDRRGGRRLISDDELDQQLLEFEEPGEDENAHRISGSVEDVARTTLDLLL